MMRQDSDFGPIPPEWAVKPLSEVCVMRSGGTPPKSVPSFWTGDFPWISGKDLKSTRLSDSIDHITKEAAEAYSKIAPAGSVLVLVRGMGLANGFALSLIERPMAFNQDLKALIPNAELSGPFLMHALTFAGQRMLRNVADAAHGTKRLTQDDLDVFKLPLPSLHEQQAIATVLDRLGLAIDVERRATQRTTELKRTALRELFSRGLRGEVQKETEIGPVPQSWEVVSFESVREWLQYGTSIRCSVEPAEHPVLRIPNIEPGRVNPDDLKYCDFDGDEAATYLLEKGDLLFIRTNGVIERLGSCAVYEGVPERTLFASYLIRARLKRDVIEPRFAALFFGSEQGTALVAGRATPAADGKYNINTGTIESLPLPLPNSLEEQREIVAAIDAIDSKAALHRQKQKVLEELFWALLHRMMTGEIRAAELDLTALESTTSRGITA